MPTAGMPTDTPRSLQYERRGCRMTKIQVCICELQTQRGIRFCDVLLVQKRLGCTEASFAYRKIGRSSCGSAGGVTLCVRRLSQATLLYYK